ncbi:helix-turn-helix transcriptional regulator [Paracoccus alcaliphilus]|uniref:helix-turn-helix transcriptional regulator n=1 Tax=Paracoccus alcaliphilus TaxID=34002 RepID=UPI000B891D10|nr:AraC family transcriptional regulator [Paracoccus alcaliphilus]WCR20878.1 helix-turn-helix transcriptional regulator [Paracoccus alcaliphilus]
MRQQATATWHQDIEHAFVPESWWIPAVGVFSGKARPCRPGRSGSVVEPSYLLDCLRSYLGAHWQPDLIRIIGQDRPRARRLERIFSVPTRCGYAACGIEFAPVLLAALRPAVALVAPTHATSAMPHGPACLATIRAAALIDVLSGAPRAASIASRLGLSRRSLQRRLADHGTTLSILIGTLRYERARTLLIESPLSISMIAENLGYADPAHFTRAFRAWAGMSPSDYRGLACH